MQEGTINDQIIRLQQLLKLEKEEDFDRYRQEVLLLSLSEKRKRGLTWHPLMVVKEGFTLGERAFVIVERHKDHDAPHRFKSGAPVSLYSLADDKFSKSDDRSQSGVIHFVDKHKMKIILNAKDFPDWLSNGQLGVDLLFDERTYSEMEKVLKLLMDTKTGRLSELKAILLGSLKARWHTLPDVHQPYLNEAQKKAVQNVLAAESLLSYYIDGNLIGTRNSSNFGTIANDHPLWIGKDRATNNTFEGNISQVRIWNVARTQLEIQELMNFRLSNPVPGLIASWELTDGDGQTVMDQLEFFPGQLGGSSAIEDTDPTWSTDGCEVETLVGVDMPETMTINLYPNPTSDLITVSTTNDESLYLEIIDLNGKILFSKEDFSKTITIDLTGFTNGIYFIQLTNGSESIVEKVVKSIGK